MKIAKRPLLLATIIGFLTGCGVMCLIMSREPAPAKIFAPAPSTSGPLAAVKQAQTRNSEKLQKAGGTPAQEALHNAELRRALEEIHRSRRAGVDVYFFAAKDGKVFLSQQFINFFNLSPVEAAKLSGLIQASRAELWKAQKAQAQVTPTDTGGIVIRIPALDAGPDIYDKVMNGFLSVLGNDRYQDMMLYNHDQQFEGLFDEFGGEGRMVTFEKVDADHYKFSDSEMAKFGPINSFSVPSATLDEIRTVIRNPELLDLVPASWK